MLGSNDIFFLVIPLLPSLFPSMI